MSTSYKEIGDESCYIYMPQKSVSIKVLRSILQSYKFWNE